MFSTPGIVKPRWCSCQIQILSRKPTNGALGRGHQAERCPCKAAHFAPPNSFLCPKTARGPSKKAKGRERVFALHVCRDFLVTKSPLLPSNSAICPRNGQKMAKNGSNCATFVAAPQNQERAVSWATSPNTPIRGHLVHPEPPTFWAFEAPESPNVTPRPPYYWSLGAGRGRPVPPPLGANQVREYGARVGKFLDVTAVEIASAYETTYIMKSFLGVFMSYSCIHQGF